MVEKMEWKNKLGIKLSMSCWNRTKHNGISMYWCDINIICKFSILHPIFYEKVVYSLKYQLGSESSNSIQTFLLSFQVSIFIAFSPILNPELVLFPYYLVRIVLCWVVVECCMVEKDIFSFSMGSYSLTIDPVRKSYLGGKLR